jgi:type IV fimbrial biogenesis protein FimT
MRITVSRQTGLTAIELMITLAVFAIMASLAGPPMQTLMMNYRERTGVNQVAGYVRLARSEAITRSVPVSMCGSSDGLVCDGNMSEGWLVFEDANGNGAFDAPNDSVIREGTFGIGQHFFTNADGSSDVEPLTYGADGGRRGGELSWRLCFSDTAREARQIDINAAGYYQVTRVSVLGCGSE